MTFCMITAMVLVVTFCMITAMHLVPHHVVGEARGKWP